ncbi:Vacuolar protein-sorting-associated protein 36 [Termitomyces sp. T112]|nr:Vacuolar protein-sorting-associated protein 36 [Termitomyces sp. T112]
MTLRRTTRFVDGTIPIQALLYTDEEVYTSQDNVGIYDGTQKSPNHQAGTIILSTHRLFYIDAQNAYKHSFSLDLSTVTQTEYYAGLFKSSPKVTLHVTGNSSASDQVVNIDSGEDGFETWVCEVCGYRNPPGLSPAASGICGLCGVPRASVPPSITSGSGVSYRSESLPASSATSALLLSSSSSSDAVSDSSSNACPVCTFLNHPALKYCEMCLTELPRLSPKASRVMKSAPSSRPPSPDLDDEDAAYPHFLKISFRKGGDKAFYTVLKRSLQSKVWESHGIRYRPKTSDTSLKPGPDTSRYGITGILRTVETSAQGQEDGMLDALQDLEALRIKAKDMVRLAAELNEKLTAISMPETQRLSNSIPPPEPEEATFIRSSLSQLGLQMANAPVTLDMMKDEKRWIEELARELAQVLQGSSHPHQEGGSGGMMRKRGVIALDEVWGGWNRARGIALIPPSTFLLVLPQLPFFTDPPIRDRMFASGLRVLHTPLYTHASFSARFSGFLALEGPKTVTEVAQEEGITLGLATEMIAAVEADGDICRDDGESAIAGGGEVRWWANLFAGYTWDGQE